MKILSFVTLFMCAAALAHENDRVEDLEAIRAALVWANMKCEKIIAIDLLLDLKREDPTKIEWPRRILVSCADGDVRHQYSYKTSDGFSDMADLIVHGSYHNR